MSALALGFAAGLRTMTPAAVLALRRLRRERPILGGALAMLAVGELVADKLPGVPARTAPAPSIARAAMGACVGAIASPRGLSRIAGAALGTIGAVLGTRLGYAVRRDASRRAPDFVVALTEDLVAVAVAVAACSLTTRSVSSGRAGWRGAGA
jgi:uncharacterized membrane protein